MFSDPEELQEGRADLPKKAKKDEASKPTSAGTVGYEQELWQMADNDSSDYMIVAS